MIDFLRALTDPDLGFLRLALLAGLLASIGLGVTGTWVVARRMSSMAGAVAHSVLAGIGAALYLQAVAGWNWLSPTLGAVAAALLSALIIWAVSLRSPQREETVINALWAMGMAVGLIFLNATPGYVDPMSYLFGNILLLRASDLWSLVALDLVVLAGAVVLHPQLQSLAFDEEFARLRGVPVRRWRLVLLALVALTVVLLVQVVGTVLVIALLTIPAAIGSFGARRLGQVMIRAIALGMAFSFAGLALSYRLDWPAGPAIIVVAGLVYLAASLFRGLARSSPRGGR